jgi:hypothetical protein
VRDELALGVPHRHVVFALPQMLRPYFLHDRSLLTDLARWAWESPREVMAAVAPSPGARPGALFVVHTAGALLDFNPHLHEELFRRRVLGELRTRGLLSEELFALLSSWRT